MEVTILNVSHGFCAYLIADNKNVMLIDAGHNQETGLRPSEWLSRKGCTGIEYLVITNYDQDHVSDLHNIVASPKLPIDTLIRNKSVTPDWLERRKSSYGVIPLGMQALLKLMRNYTDPVTNGAKLQGVDYQTFRTTYPEFNEENDLSLVIFIEHGELNLVFPGDLERPGWKKLLENPRFRNELAKVKVFVASHHGRESGYCEDVFDICTPDLVIISDEYKHFETQETNYARHVRGVRWTDGTRRVLTTRSDGSIRISHTLGQDYTIQTGVQL